MKKLSEDKKAKLPLAELHPDFEVLLTKSMQVGKERGYGEHSWLNTEDYPTSGLVSAAMRHINKFRRGEIYNHEEGCTTVTQHLAHAAFGLLAAAVQVQNELEKGEGHDG